MKDANHNLRRVFAAWVCLAAAMCLYTSLGLAAWPTSVSCCTGDHCAIPQHHHDHGASRAAWRDMNHEMGRALSHGSDRNHGAQCEHSEHGGVGMAECGMSCCDPNGDPPIASVAYVLPMPITVNAAPMTVRNTPLAEPAEFLRATKPLSPPPRA